MINVGDLITLTKRGRRNFLPFYHYRVPLGLVVKRPGHIDRFYPETHKYNIHKRFEIVWLHYKDEIPEEIERKWIKPVKTARFK